MVCPECGVSIRLELRSGSTPVVIPAKIVLWWAVVYGAVVFAQHVVSFFPNPGWHMSIGQAWEYYRTAVGGYPSILMGPAFGLFAVTSGTIWLLRMRGRVFDGAFQKRTIYLCVALLLVDVLIEVIAILI
jgi:hypothetical protein